MQNLVFISQFEFVNEAPLGLRLSLVLSSMLLGGSGCLNPLFSRSEKNVQKGPKSTKTANLEVCIYFKIFLQPCVLRWSSWGGETLLLPYLWFGPTFIAPWLLVVHDWLLPMGRMGGEKNFVAADGSEARGCSVSRSNINFDRGFTVFDCFLLGTQTVLFFFQNLHF